MLEIRKTAVSFDEGDLMELERIVTDGDEKEALRFVKKVVYDRIPAEPGHVFDGLVFLEVPVRILYSNHPVDDACPSQCHPQRRKVEKMTPFRPSTVNVCRICEAIHSQIERNGNQKVGLILNGKGQPDVVAVNEPYGKGIDHF